MQSVPDLAHRLIWFYCFMSWIGQNIRLCFFDHFQDSPQLAILVQFTKVSSFPFFLYLAWPHRPILSNNNEFLQVGCEIKALRSYLINVYFHLVFYERFNIRVVFHFKLLKTRLSLALKIDNFRPLFFTFFTFLFSASFFHCNDSIVHQCVHPYANQL